MSDLRDAQEQASDLQNLSNKELSRAYKTKETSIGEIASCNASLNQYKVYLIDEDLIVTAYRTGILNDWLGGSSPQTGDLCLVEHKATSDSVIVALLDKGRSKAYADNLDSSPYNKNRIMKLQAP